MRSKKILISVFALSMIFACFIGTADAARDTIKISGETTLFSEDFEGYDDINVLSDIYGRRLDDWAHGTIYYEGEKEINAAIVDGCQSENAVLACERIASSNSRKFAVEVPMSRWKKTGTIHIQADIRTQASITQNFNVYEGNNIYRKVTILNDDILSKYIGEWLEVDISINLDNDTYKCTLKNAITGAKHETLQGEYALENVAGFVFDLNKSTSSSWSDLAPIIDNIYIGAQTREADKNVFKIQSFNITDASGNLLTSLNGARTINAKISVKSGRNISKSTQIFAAIYSNDGRLKALSDTQKLFREGYDDATIGLNLKTAAVGTDKAYIYIWDSTKLNPVFDKLDLDKKIYLEDVPDNIDLHNDTVRAYLNDRYDSCSKYAIGEAFLDAPKPVTLNWVSDTGYSSYIVRVSENADMSDVWEYEAYSTSYDVFNLKVGTTYYWTITARNGDTDVYTSEVKTFTTNDQAPRNLYVQGGLANLRDVGGWNTTDGKKILQGLVYRSRCFEFMEDGSFKVRVNSLGIEEMKERLGVKTEIDFRSTEFDGSKYPTGRTNTLGIEYYQCPLTLDGDYLSVNKESIKKIFNIFAYDKNYPIDYHCTVGADRTGMITWLLNGLAGVGKEDLYRDYLMTNFHDNSKSRDISEISSKYVKTLDDYMGNTLQEKIYNYLSTEIGVPTEKLDHIIYIMRNGLGETPQYAGDVAEPSFITNVVLDEDFESNVSEGSDYGANGGWMLDGKSGYGSGYNSNTAFYPTWGPGNSTARNETRNSVYFLPTEYSGSNGVYTINFDFYKGSNANNNPIRIGSGRSYTTESSLAIVDLYSSAYADNGMWENVNMEIDADTMEYTLTIKRADGSIKKSESGTLDLASIDYISFGDKAGNTKADSANTDASGFYSKIDNLKITQTVENTVTEPGVILNEKFERELKGSSNYAVNGGWVLDEKSGYGTGYNSNLAFYPAWGPGNSTARGETRSSEYYIPASDVENEGNYTISFDFYKGSNANHNPIKIGSGREYSAENSVTIADLYSTSYADDNAWENVIIEINAKTMAYTLIIKKTDGSIKKSESGTLNLPSVDYISFGDIAGNTKSASDNTDASGFYSKIDNLKISHIK